MSINIRPLSKAKQMAFASRTEAEAGEAPKVDFRAKFDALMNESNDAQLKLFLKSFIFALGDDWKQVVDLAARFNKYLSEQNEVTDLDPVQAADFLQKNGKTRTAAERKTELQDIDLDMNGRVGLTEYLLLHYKVMILTEYFKRHETSPTVDLSNEGVGLVGVGDMLVEELFTFPVGMDPEIEAAIEEFMAMKKAKEEKISALEARAAKGGVSGLAAKNELFQLESADKTGENRLEITLKAAQRRASKSSAADMLAKKEQAEIDAVAKKRRDSRAALAARAALFEKS